MRESHVHERARNERSKTYHGGWEQIRIELREQKDLWRKCWLGWRWGSRPRKAVPVPDWHRGLASRMSAKGWKALAVKQQKITGKPRFTISNFRRWGDARPGDELFQASSCPSLGNKKAEGLPFWLCPLLSVYMDFIGIPVLTWMLKTTWDEPQPHTVSFRGKGKKKGREKGGDSCPFPLDLTKEKIPSGQKVDSCTPGQPRGTSAFQLLLSYWKMGLEKSCTWSWAVKEISAYKRFLSQ